MTYERARLDGITAGDLAGALTGHAGDVADLVADMMTKATLIALCAALLACLGLAGALWWRSGTVSDLMAENGRLTRGLAAMQLQADQSRLAADVAAARAARASQMTIEANATIEAIRNLQLGECADAQIDPDLAAILGRRDVPAED
ncbi:MAG TPA: hypothetical protein DF966_04280 [Sulfitobacter sp.]|nr:hypothetical protein [Sulfitobacter sp.]